MNIFILTKQFFLIRDFYEIVFEVGFYKNYKTIYVSRDCGTDCFCIYFTQKSYRKYDVFSKDSYQKIVEFIKGIIS